MSDSAVLGTLPNPARQSSTQNVGENIGTTGPLGF